MDNLKDLSFLELIDMQNKINEELEKRRLNKDSICDSLITDQFFKDWADKGISFWDRGKFYHKFNSFIYGICDYTLENYKIVSSSHSEKQIKLNGSRINIKDPNLYIKMSDEIFGIIKKYYEESHGHKMTKMTEEEGKLLNHPENWSDDEEED